MTQDYVLWVVPIKPGQTDAARRYCQALESTRRKEFEASQQEIGINREIFFLWTHEGKDHIILYMDGADMERAMKLWVEHTGDFEVWGKNMWTEFSEPSDWPEPRWAAAGINGLPEILSVYDKDRMN